MEDVQSLDSLFEVVVSDSPRAGLVDHCQLDQINWRPRCHRIVGVPTSRLSPSMTFVQLDHEVLGLSRGTLVPLILESIGTSKALKLVLSKKQIDLIRKKGCLVFE